MKVTFNLFNYCTNLLLYIKTHDMTQKTLPTLYFTLEDEELLNKHLRVI